MTDKSPKGIELNLGHFVMPNQQFLDLLHLRGREVGPGHQGLFLDPLDAMDRGERISLGQHHEALNDCFLVVLHAVEDCSFGFRDGFSEGASLTSFLGSAKFADIARIHAPIIRASRIPAERAGRH